MNLKKILAVASTLCMMCTAVPFTGNIIPENTVLSVNAAETELDLSPEAVYQTLIAFQETYPEGTPWTNDNSYKGNSGCVAFALILSDAVFGTLRGRTYNDVNEIRVGDILRINNDTHSVIVLDVTDDVVTVAEGNFNKSIHWGRTFTLSRLNEIMTYAYTRYPEPEPEVTHKQPEKGDMNLDDKTDILDIIQMQKWLLGKTDYLVTPHEDTIVVDNMQEHEISDMNGDNIVNIYDLILLKRKVLETA